MSTLDEEFTPPSIGEIAALLPAYEINSFIAKGGMGAVYMARQKSLDRAVAIKILPRKFGADKTFRESFEQEAKSMAKFNHPNLVSIYDFGQVDGLLYFIMEMVQGQPLYYSCYGKKIAPKEANRIVVEVCNGLAHAHGHGILHRDIKPANILLDPKATPKIGDFGLARGLEDHASDQAFGTPGYTAPEVTTNPTAVGECTDIYSVGIMLYELLTSKIPEAPYTPVTSIIKCDPRYDEVILKAVHADPSMRYQSAAEMSAALSNIQNSAAPAQAVASPFANSEVTSPTRIAAPKVNKPENIAANRSISSPSKFTPEKSNVTTRNLVIIVVLLAAIVAGWQGLKVAEKKRLAENKKIEELNKQNAQAKAPKKAAQAKAGPQGSGESPLESLARLQNQLKRGKRGEMPKGTISNNERSRFYIKESMSWHEASRYAESYGGHLAVFPTTDDLNTFASKIQTSDLLWTGGGSAGNDTWQWIDGSTWNHQVRNSSKLSFITVNKYSILSPSDPNKKHSFYIEWLNDGSNPSSLDKQLQRTANSISSSNPKYPPGTVSYDDRHYFLVSSQSLNWDAAVDLASSSGGHLAIPSNKYENEWMLSFIDSNIPSGESCWIGGLCENGKDWKWETGEPWSLTSWKKGPLNAKSSSPYACAITSGKVWHDIKTSKKLSYTLIEWSDDSKNIPYTGVISPEVTDLKLKCRNLLRTITAKHDPSLISNTKNFTFALAKLKTDMSADEKDALKPIVNQITNFGRSKSLNSSVKSDIPQKLDSVYKTHIKKQQAIESKIIEEVENIRTHYIEKLEIISKELEKKGQKPEIQHAQYEMNAASVETSKFSNHIFK